MKKTGVALLCLFTLSIFNLFAQENETKIPAFHRVDFISPGYRYEFPLAGRFTGSAGFETIPYYTETSAYLSHLLHFQAKAFYLLPYVETGVQWRYSDARRIRMNKDISHHIGSYVNLSGRYYVEALNIPLYRENVDGIYSGGFTWRLTWGIRRPAGDAVVWDLFTGFESNIGDRVMSGGLILGVRLGLVL